MRIRIEEDVYEGTPMEIMEELWDGSFDRQQFSGLDGYITYMEEAFTRMTELPCELPRASTYDRAKALLLRLADIDALEVLDDE